VSGANVQTWENYYNDKNASKETYPICLDGIIIPELNPYGLYGAGLSIKSNNNGFQIIISNNAMGFRYWQGDFYQTWRPLFQN